MNTIIIKIESGVVADVYSTIPIQVVVVDHDVIEGGETFERRMEKAVLTMSIEQCIRPDDVSAMVRALVLECIRPRDLVYCDIPTPTPPMSHSMQSKTLDPLMPTGRHGGQ